MSRFLHYINEESDEELLNDFLLKIQRDCKQWLKESRGLPFYRGMKVSSHPKELYIGSTVENRKPVDLNQNITSILDSFFLKKFGWEARTNHVLFATRKYNDAIGYSNRGKPAYLIFPIGDIKYIYSQKIVDPINLNTMLIKNFYKENKDYYDKIFNGTNPLENEKNYAKLESDIKAANKEKFHQFVFKYLDSLDYTNKHIYTATYQEVMIQCKHYYYIEAPMGSSFINNLEDRIRG